MGLYSFSPRVPTASAALGLMQAAMGLSGALDVDETHDRPNVKLADRHTSKPGLPLHLVNTTLRRSGAVEAGVDLVLPTHPLIGDVVIDLTEVADDAPHVRVGVPRGVGFRHLHRDLKELHCRHHIITQQFRDGPLGLSAAPAVFGIKEAVSTQAS